MYRSTSRYGDTNFQEKVQQVSKRISAVLEDYEKSTPEKTPHGGSRLGAGGHGDASPAEAFRAESSQMQADMAGLLAQVEDRTRNRMQALGAVQASLSSLGNAQALEPEYLAGLASGSGGGGGSRRGLMALRGPGADVRGHDISEGRRKPRDADARARWDVDTKGFDEALANAYGGREKLSTNFDSVVTLFRKHGMAGSEAMRRLKLHIKDLMAALDRAAEELRLRDKKVLRLTSDGKELRDRIAVVNSRCERASEEVASIEVELRDSERQRITAEERLKQVSSELSDAMAVANRAEKEAARAKRSNEANEHRVKGLSEKVRMLGKQVRALQATIAGDKQRELDPLAMVEELQQLREQVRLFPEQQAKAIDEAVSQAVAEALKKEHAEREDIIRKRISDAMGVHELRQEGLVEEIDGLHERVDSLTSENRQLRTDALRSDEQIQRLEDQLFDAKNDLSEARTQAVEARQAMERAMRASSAAGKKRAPAVRPASEINRLAEKATKHKSAGMGKLLDTVLADIIRQAAREDAARQQATDAANLAHASEVERLRDQIAVMERQARSPSHGVHALQKELALARTKAHELEVIQKQLASERKTLQARVELAQAEAATVSKKLKATEEVSVRYQSKFSELEMGLDFGEGEETERLQRENKALSADLQAAHRQVHELRVELDALKQREKTLKKTVDRAGLETPSTKKRRQGKVRGMITPPDSDDEVTTDNNNMHTGGRREDDLGEDSDDSELGGILTAGLGLDVAATDLYGDMREVGTSTEGLQTFASSGTQTSVTGQHLAQLRARLAKHEEDDGTVSGALARWSKSRVVEEYQKLRRIAWDIRNENTRLLASNKDLKRRVEMLEPAYARLQRNQEANQLIAEAMSSVQGGGRADVMRALASVRASVEHRLHEVRSAAQLAVGELQSKLQRQTTMQMMARNKLAQAVKANRVINMMKGGSGSLMSMLSGSAPGGRVAHGSVSDSASVGTFATHTTSPTTRRPPTLYEEDPLHEDPELHDLIDHHVASVPPTPEQGTREGRGAADAQPAAPGTMPTGPGPWRQLMEGRQQAAAQPGGGDVAAGMTNNQKSTSEPTTKPGAASGLAAETTFGSMHVPRSRETSAGGAGVSPVDPKPATDGPASSSGADRINVNPHAALPARAELGKVSSTAGQAQAMPTKSAASSSAPSQTASRATSAGGTEPVYYAVGVPYKGQSMMRQMVVEGDPRPAEETVATVTSAAPGHAHAAAVGSAAAAPSPEVVSAPAATAAVPAGRTSAPAPLAAPSPAGRTQTVASRPATTVLATTEGGLAPDERGAGAGKGASPSESVMRGEPRHERPAARAVYIINQRRAAAHGQPTAPATDKHATDKHAGPLVDGHSGGMPSTGAATKSMPAAGSKPGVGPGSAWPRAEHAASSMSAAGSVSDVTGHGFEHDPGHSHPDWPDGPAHPMHGIRHEGDTSWLNVGMGKFDPWADLQSTRDSLARTEVENERLLRHLHELESELHSAVRDGEAWKMAAAKLDRRLKSKELEDVMYSTLDDEAEFGEAVSALATGMTKLRKNLDSGHVDFTYMSKFVETMRARSLRTLSKIKQRLQRKRQGTVHLPDRTVSGMSTPSNPHHAYEASTAVADRRRSMGGLSISSGDPPLGSARSALASSVLKPSKAQRRRGRNGKGARRGHAARRDPSGAPVPLSGRSSGSAATAATTNPHPARGLGTAGIRFEPLPVPIGTAADAAGASGDGAPLSVRSRASRVSRASHSSKASGGRSPSLTSATSPPAATSGASGVPLSGEQQQYSNPQSRRPAKRQGPVAIEPVHHNPYIGGRGAASDVGDTFLPLLSPSSSRKRLRVPPMEPSTRSGQPGSGLRPSASEPTLPSVAGKAKRGAGKGASRGKAAAGKQNAFFGNHGGGRRGEASAKGPKGPAWKRLPLDRTNSRSPPPPSDRSYGPWPASGRSRTGTGASVRGVPRSPAERARR